jgi:hypothetical protein
MRPSISQTPGGRFFSARSRPDSSDPQRADKQSVRTVAVSAHWGSELGTSHVLVANMEQDCSESSNPLEHGLIAVERLLRYASRGHGGLVAASLQVRERRRR